MVKWKKVHLDLTVFFQVYAERESAKIIRKVGDRVIIQRDSKHQYSLEEVIHYCFPLVLTINFCQKL